MPLPRGVMQVVFLPFILLGAQAAATAPGPGSVRVPTLRCEYGAEGVAQ
jgi:hypothetical protein